MGLVRMSETFFGCKKVELNSGQGKTNSFVWYLVAVCGVAIVALDTVHFFTLQGEPQYTEKLTLIEHRDIDRVRTGCTDSSSMKAPMLCELCTHNLSGLRDSQAIVFGYKVCGCMCIVFVKDLSPIIDIYLPSPSIKKTHGRQTSHQGACVAKLSISRASHPVEEAGNASLQRVRGGGRGWPCYSSIKKKILDVAEKFELLLLNPLT